MKRLTIICLLGLLCSFAAACTPSHRDPKIEKQTLLYAVKEHDSLRLDRYTLAAADGPARPCMIFMFGGGFFTGARDAGDYIDFFHHLCRRGFDVVSIDYRLGMKPYVGSAALTEATFAPVFIQALSMAVEDLYSATACVLQHAGEWGVDPSRIVTCGSSAGAITVLMGEYGLCNGSPLAAALPEGFDYAGVVSFAGAIFDRTDDLRWARQPAPMQLFHGDADRNVPYGAVRYEGVGFFGSEYIARQLQESSVPHWFYAEADADHKLAVSPMNDLRCEIDAFLDRLVLRREPLMIDTHVQSTDRPVAEKDFSIGDYIRANFSGE